MSIYDQIIKKLQDNNILFREVKHEPEGRCDVISEIRGNKLSQAMKAIVIKAKITKKQRKYYLVVVPGDRLLDMEAIKEFARTRSTMFAQKEKAEELTQCEMGAVPPFTFNKDLTLIVDPSIKLNEEIVFNAGRLDRSIFMKTSDYLKIADPDFVNIAKNDPVTSKKDDSATLKEKAPIY